MRLIQLAKMLLFNFPTEILYDILEHFDLHDINALVQTNRQLYQSFNSTLYHFDREYCNSSALLWAATYGRTRTAQKSLSAKANNYGFRDQADHLQAALFLAVESGHHAMVAMLVDNHANVNAQGGWFGNALQMASWLGDYHMMKLLIDRGADINMQCGYYGNALQAASWRASWAGDDGAVRLLLDHNANVNARGGYFGHALQAASWGGNLQIMKLLINRGADLHMQGGHYGNALQAASWRGHQHIVSMLLNLGAEVEAQGGRYHNALQAASIGGHRRISCLLQYSRLRQLLKSYKSLTCIHP